MKKYSLSQINFECQIEKSSSIFLDLIRIYNLILKSSLTESTARFQFIHNLLCVVVYLRLLLLCMCVGVCLSVSVRVCVF